MRLEVRGLSLVRGGRRILTDVDLAVDEGELVVLVGPNGAGKTSLVRALLGLERPDAGTVRCGGEEVSALPARERAARLAWLPQHLRRPDPIPAVEAVAAARFRFREPRARRLEAARRALDEAGAAALADRPVDALSGGEAQRVAVASLLAQEAPVWLLDEPANHLDPAVQLGLHAFLAARWAEGRTLVFVTHDLHRLADFLDGPRPARVVGLADGTVRFDRRLDDDALDDALGALLDVAVRRVVDGGRTGWLVGPREGT